MAEYRQEPHRREMTRAAGRRPDGASRAAGPDGGSGAGQRDADRVLAAMAAWRAAAAATADPQWARPGTAVAWPADAGLGTQAAAGDGHEATCQPTAGRPARTAPSAVPRRRSGLAALVPAVLAGAGAVMTLVASTMTWATVRALGMVRYSVAGMDADQHGRLAAGLGLLVALAAVGLAAGPRGHAARLLRVLAGAGGLVTVFVAVLEIGYLRGGGPLAGTGLDATTVIAPGLWLLLAGGLLGVGAALLARPGRYPLPPPVGHPPTADPYPGDTRKDQVGS